MKDLGSIDDDIKWIEKEKTKKLRLLVPRKTHYELISIPTNILFGTFGCPCEVEYELAPSASTHNATEWQPQRKRAEQMISQNIPNVLMAT